jgi:hypothetical protein
MNRRGPSDVTKWWLRQLDLRTVFFIIGGLVSGFVTLAYFWKDSHENWDETKALKVVVAFKAEKEELKTAVDRLNKMYDRFNAVNEELEEINIKAAKQEQRLQDYIEFNKK